VCRQRGQFDVRPSSNGEIDAERGNFALGEGTKTGKKETNFAGTTARKRNDLKEKEPACDRGRRFSYEEKEEGDRAFETVRIWTPIGSSCRGLVISSHKGGQPS